nr:hypothetical protein [Kitasatospora sp. DSM 101779]
MNDMFEALEALTDRDPDRRDIAADALGDLLRGAALDADSTRLVVGRLVSVAVNEPVAKVRESALNSVSEAFNHHHLPLGLAEPLAAAVPTMEREPLAHTLYILGVTHPDPEVREEARLAVSRGHRRRVGGSHLQLLTIALHGVQRLAVLACVRRPRSLEAGQIVGGVVQVTVAVLLDQPRVRGAKAAGSNGEAGGSQLVQGNDVGGPLGRGIPGQGAHPVERQVLEDHAVTLILAAPRMITGGGVPGLGEEMAAVAVDASAVHAYWTFAVAVHAHSTPCSASRASYPGVSLARLAFWLFNHAPRPTCTTSVLSAPPGPATVTCSGSLCGRGTRTWPSRRAKAASAARPWAKAVLAGRLRLGLRRGLRRHQVVVLLDADRRQQVLLIGLQSGQAGSLRHDPAAELLALEHGLLRQLHPVNPAVGLQPPLPRDAVGALPGDRPRPGTRTGRSPPVAARFFCVGVCRCAGVSQVDWSAGLRTGQVGG